MPAGQLAPAGSCRDAISTKKQHNKIANLGKCVIVRSMIAVPESPPYQAFRQNVRRMMEMRSISQVQLADRAGIKQPSLSRMLSGGAEPRLSTVHKIAGALGTHAAFLLTDFSEKTAAAS